VVAIAGGVGFTVAVTSNGQVYAWGDNSFGELGTNSSAVASTNAPILVAGISNAVWISAPRSDDGLGGVYVSVTNAYSGGVYSLAMTLDPVDGTGHTTNNYWGWGDNTYGQVGNATNNGGATNQISQYTPAGPLQFCTRCQREVQLGTMGTFTAKCNGTLYLYFNTDNYNYGSNEGGSYSATVNGTNVTVYPTNFYGVAVGTVTNGGVYSFTASGYCVYNPEGFLADPNGVDPSSNQVACSFGNLNITNSACPSDKCFSLVGKIQ
jgi:alpha-tubulin suppressor-like RCC1 family protein